VAKRVNYAQEKRQRELAKQKKKAKKTQEKAERRKGDDAPGGSPQRQGGSDADWLGNNGGRERSRS